MIEVEINLDRLIRYGLYIVLMTICGIIFIKYNYLMVQAAILIAVTGASIGIGYYAGSNDMADEIYDIIVETTDDTEEAEEKSD